MTDKKSIPLLVDKIFSEQLVMFRHCSNSLRFLKFEWLRTDACKSVLGWVSTFPHLSYGKIWSYWTESQLDGSHTSLCNLLALLVMLISIGPRSGLIGCPCVKSTAGKVNALTQSHFNATKKMGR